MPKTAAKRRGTNRHRDKPRNRNKVDLSSSYPRQPSHLSDHPSPSGASTSLPESSRGDPSLPPLPKSSGRRARRHHSNSDSDSDSDSDSASAMESGSSSPPPESKYVKSEDESKTAAHGSRRWHSASSSSGSGSDSSSRYDNDALLRKFERGSLGMVDYRNDNDLMQRGHWSLWLAHIMTIVFGINAPSALWRVYSLTIAAAVTTVTVVQIVSLFSDFSDLEHGIIVLLAALWYLLNMLTAWSFALRFWGHTGWLFGMWKAMWQSEADVCRSHHRLRLLMPAVIFGVVANLALTLAARWFGLQRDAQSVFREMFVLSSNGAQVVFTIIHVFATGIFLTPLALFFDTAVSLTRRIHRLQKKVFRDEKSLTELVDDFSELSVHAMLANKLFGPWLTCIFAVQIPLVAICLVSLLSYTSLDGLTISVLALWLVVNTVLTFTVAFISAKLHADTEATIHKIALHVASGRSSSHRSEFMFFTASISAHEIGFRVGGSVLITFHVMTKVISFIGSLYLLLVGFRAQ